MDGSKPDLRLLAGEEHTTAGPIHHQGLSKGVKSLPLMMWSLVGTPGLASEGPAAALLPVFPSL